MIAAPVAADHRDPCHTAHVCPSDHSTYAWRGLICAKKGDEAASQRVKVKFGGKVYYCRKGK